MGRTIRNRNSSTNNVSVIRNTQQPFPFYVGNMRRNDKANEYRELKESIAKKEKRLTKEFYRSKQ
ncbi:hypothetical protein JHK86_034010 [Glycine max]|nr:hypothetical protein JHK86_034010 [Glycine max]